MSTWFDADNKSTEFFVADGAPPTNRPPQDGNGYVGGCVLSEVDKASTASARLAHFALDLRYEDIPASVVEAAKLHLLDTLGCGLAAHALGVGTAGRSAAARGGAWPATIIGRAEHATATEAAFANGMLCHGLDFDDTHGKSICHIGVVAVPALMAAAESHGRSGRDLLLALVAGSEVIARLGSVVAPEYMVRGFHPTSVCGVFGAAVGASRLLDLRPAQALSALGIAGSMAGGLFAYLSDGSATKPIHAGLAARNGVQSAQLAAFGGEGPATVFEDRFGFFAAYYGDYREAFEQSLSDLGVAWESEQTSFKAYPACHFIHGCLDAASELRQESGWAPSAIASVTVAIPDAGVPLVLEPIELKRRPRTDYEGKFSIPYSVAAMLVHGRVDVATYLPEALRDKDVAAVAARVEYVRRPFDTYPESFPGWMRIESTCGQTLKREVLRQRGAPENPMSELDVLTKFRLNATLSLDADAVAALETAVLTLEEVDDVRAFTDTLAQAGQTSGTL